VAVNWAAVQLEHLLEDGDSLLIANNTMLECNSALRGWDEKVRGKGVRIQNNLVLGSLFNDFYVMASTTQAGPAEPGEGAQAAALWQFDHNYRETRPPSGNNQWNKSWIPPSDKDVRLEKIAGIERDPKSPHFLRPDKKSDLATKGAGVEDPSLPSYVGAVPPEGVEPWDWDRTWLAWPGTTKLLTVSKDEKDGGKYRKINDALAAAKPWDTIRVLDDGIYQETISFNDPNKHRGIAVEAVKGATLDMAQSVRRLIAIQDVPHVRVTGFKLTEKSSSADVTRAFVAVSGTAEGVALTHLELTADSKMFGVVVQNTVATPAAPLRIAHCTIRSGLLGNDGISVVGNIDNEPLSALCIHSNLIFNAQRGINIHGAVRNVHVAGNLVVNCIASGLQLEDLISASNGVLVANNTCLGGQGAFRVWDNAPYKDHVAGQVEVANNLFFQASFCEVAYVLDPGKGGDQLPGDGKNLLKLWAFHHNRRDMSGASPVVAIPMAPDDGRLKPNDLLSTAPEDSDRLRPNKDSPLATQGAGAKDHSLPAYIGAFPPEGVAPWDWDRTWRARLPKSLPMGEAKEKDKSDK
jgi:hypothetical protein